MDEDIEGKIFKLLEEKKKSSMKSKAYSLYELFNPINSKNDTYKICDDKNDKHKKPDKMNSDTLQLCHNIEHIFSTFSVLCPSYDKVDSKCCEYLLYWLYGKVSNGEYDLFNIHWLYYKFHMLLEKKTLYPGKNIKCSANFLRILNRKILKNKKALYDFLDHYDIIKEELNASGTERDNKIKYCKYIGYIFRLFENMLMDRNSQSIQAYRHEMKNFKAKIIDEDLDFIKKSCDTDSQKSMFRIDKKTLLTLINEQLKDVKTTDVSFRNKHLYDIFWDINTYEEYESYARGNKNAYSAASEYYCKPDKLNAAEDYNKIKDLCKVFIPYFLYISYNNDQNVPSGRRHLGYMNYWLNKELKEKKIRATDFIDVLNALLDNKFSAIDNYNKFKNIVYNIDDKIFEELDLLRKLQDYYNKIITESTDKDKCPEYGRNFTKLFEEGIRKYHETKNKKFYIELLRIWARYNIEANGTKKCNNLPEPPVIEKLNQKEKAASLSKTRELCKTYTNIRLDTPQHWNQEYEVLKHLSAHEVYNKLNTASSDDNICAKYCANIIHSNEYNEDFKKLCPKLTSNIKKLSETLKDINSPDNRCTYLTYWAYEKIINIFDSNTRHVHYKSAINALNQAVFMVNSELSSKDKCLFSFTGNLSEWKDEKLLHDYFKNYEKISKCSTSTNGTDCKSYCDYLKHISELYSSHINNCCSCYSYPERVCSELCPKYFKCDMGYFPSDLLYNIGCKVKEEKEKEEEEGKEEDEKSYETAEDVFRNVTVDLDVIKRSHIEKPCKGLICDAFDTFAFSSFLFLGIFFSLFVFYKVTTFLTLKWNKIVQLCVNRTAYKLYFSSIFHISVLHFRATLSCNISVLHFHPCASSLRWDPGFLEDE